MKYKDGVFTEVVVIKDGRKVRVRHSVELEAGWLATNNISKEISKKEIVITSVLDGTHMAGSKHYDGDAFDFRKWIYTEEQLRKILEILRDVLGKEFTVVEEKTHVHVQFNRK